MSPTHSALAGGVGVVFGVNTVTGLWNLWDSRHDRVGRTRRWVHVATMLASDAGFLATGVVAAEAKHSPGGARLHRGLALGSIGLSTAGTLIMWLWKD